MSRAPLNRRAPHSRPLMLKLRHLYWLGLKLAWWQITPELTQIRLEAIKQLLQLMPVDSGGRF
jgi:hypothetical protein